MPDSDELLTANHLIKKEGLPCPFFLNIFLILNLNPHSSGETHHPKKQRDKDGQ